MGLDLAAGVLLAALVIRAVRSVPDYEIHILAAGLVVAAVAYDLLGVVLAGVAPPITPVWSLVLFAALAVLGVLQSTWFLVAGWLLHAAWDFLLPGLADLSYMPGWYAGLCVGFDALAAAYLAARAAGWLVPPAGRPRAAAPERGVPGLSE